MANNTEQKQRQPTEKELMQFILKLAFNVSNVSDAAKVAKAEPRFRRASHEVA